MPQLKTHIGVEHRTRCRNWQISEETVPTSMGQWANLNQKPAPPLSQRGAGFGLNSNNTFFCKKEIAETTDD